MDLSHLKTEKRLFLPTFEQAILAVHPYDTPEIIFYPIPSKRPYTRLGE